MPLRGELSYNSNQAPAPDKAKLAGGWGDEYPYSGYVRAGWPGPAAIYIFFNSPVIHDFVLAAVKNLIGGRAYKY